MDGHAQDRLDEATETLAREQTALELAFLETDQDGQQWIVWLQIQGEQARPSPPPHMRSTPITSPTPDDAKNPVGAWPSLSSFSLPSPSDTPCGEQPASNERRERANRFRWRSARGPASVAMEASAMEAGKQKQAPAIGAFRAMRSC